MSDEGKHRFLFAQIFLTIACFDVRPTIKMGPEICDYPSLFSEYFRNAQTIRKTYFHTIE